MAPDASTEAVEQVLETARGLRPTLRERAAEIEGARRLPAGLSSRFAEAGFYRMLAPERYGGAELPPACALGVIETLAEADGSAAWCVMVSATAGSVLACMHDEGAREVFATPETVLAGVFAPRGEAHPEGDGFRVRGRWQWGSNSHNADWMLAGCRLVRGPESRERESGGARTQLMFMPASSLELLDTWYVSGLSGTGSTDFQAEDVFVPSARVADLFAPPVVLRPLYAFPPFGLLALSIAAVTLGLGRAALDELVALAGGKTPDGSARPLAARAATQSGVAEAEALLGSARAYLYRSVARAWEAARAEGAITVEHRRDLRLAATHAVRSCARVVDIAYELGGGTSVYMGSPLQRIFRDVHVATQHMMVAPPTLELTGRLLLNLDTDTSLL